MALGVTVRVRDAFAGGEGSTYGTLLGLKTVIRLEGTPEIAAGHFRFGPDSLVSSIGEVVDISYEFREPARPGPGGPLKEFDTFVPPLIQCFA
jgi:hypothetical protein